jgi:hypothetical protein
VGTPNLVRSLEETMEKRKSARTSLISDYHTQFLLGGQAFTNIKVSNIGTQGCCLQMPVASARFLKDKPVLDNLILLHANAKKYSLKGRVAWHEPALDSQEPWLTAGVEFLETPVECKEEIVARLKAPGVK